MPMFIKGPQGAQGATGAQGPTGPQGVAGAQGTIGAQGAAGAQGVQGAIGAQGTQGPTGPQGVAGAQGTIGAQGAAGAQGVQGAIGAQGTQGPTGPKGDAGAQGTQGPQGAAGAAGKDGTDGAAGAQGATGAQGPQGTQGPSGPNTLTGNGHTLTLQFSGAAVADRTATFPDVTGNVILDAGSQTISGLKTFADQSFTLQNPGATHSSTIVATNESANRTYTLPNVSGTFVIQGGSLGQGASFSAGTATAGTWPTIGSGTILTTAAVGAFEFDGAAFYLTSAASSRQLVVTPQGLYVKNDYLLAANQATTQPIFNANANGMPANGALTLQANTTYRFRANLTFTGMNALTGNGAVDWLGTGTANIASARWIGLGVDGSTQVAASICNFATLATTGNMFASGTSTQMSFIADGTFRTGTGGTIIPALIQANAAQPTLKAGSTFECWPVGSDTTVQCGNWS